MYFLLIETGQFQKPPEHFWSSVMMSHCRRKWRSWESSDLQLTALSRNRKKNNNSTSTRYTFPPQAPLCAGKGGERKKTRHLFLPLFSSGKPVSLKLTWAQMNQQPNGNRANALTSIFESAARLVSWLCPKPLNHCSTALLTGSSEVGGSGSVRLAG